jgi:hypothetical protein
MLGGYGRGVASGQAQSGVYRVTVRGRFHELSDRSRAYLVAARADHDIFVSAYTPEGTLTYDDRIDFFNLRYEHRADDSDTAAADCLVEAECFLDTMGFGHRDLRVNVADLSAMWAGSEGRTPAG